MNHECYDVVIIGAGVSGAAQAYALMKYTNITRVALIDKEEKPGLVNSSPTNNSQTLHEGDIETNYDFEKAVALKKKSGFTRTYVEGKNDTDLSLKSPKMVMGVGKKECVFLEERFKTFTQLYPTLRKLNRKELGNIEPALLKDRSQEEKLCGLYNADGLTVNYGRLAQLLVADAVTLASSLANKTLETYFSTKVINIKKQPEGYQVECGAQKLQTRFVSVCAGAHSMYFAKKLNLIRVKNLSLLCVAGNFYYTPKYIQTKIYTVQNPKLPFSAVHGDPDILRDNRTRFGPTTRMVFMLERHRYETVLDFFLTVPPVLKSLIAYIRIMSDREFLFYVLRHNVLFQIPLLGTYLFLTEARKIIPALNYKELKKARGQGGVRPQIVNTASKIPLSLGEAKFQDDHIMFNVTPSPGASTCIYNGLYDTQVIAEALGHPFDNSAVLHDFGQTIS